MPEKWSRIERLVVLMTAVSFACLPICSPADEMGTAAQNARPQIRGSTAAPPPGSGRDRDGSNIALKFRDAPLESMLDFYAGLTGRTMIRSPEIQASITLISQTDLTRREALDAMDSALAMHGIALIPLGERFYKAVSTTAAPQEGIPLPETGEHVASPGTDRLVSEVIRLSHVPLQEVQPILQGMIHGYGKVQAMERINTFMITDTASNIRRIKQVLELLDQPVELRVDTRVYELQYANANDVAARLKELTAESQASRTRAGEASVAPRRETPPGIIRARRDRDRAEQQAEIAGAELAERGIIQGEVNIVSDERTNILIVISDPANFNFFDQVIEVLDRPVEPAVIVRMLSLEYADAEEVANILNELIGATATEHRDRRSDAGERDGDMGRSEALREYALRRTRAAATGDQLPSAETLGRLSEDTKILADTRRNGLLMMGRRADIGMLEDIVTQLDVMLGQVLIEAVVLEVSLDKDLSHGVDWLQRSISVYREETSGAAGGMTVREPIISFAGGQRMREGTTFEDAGKLTDRDINLAPGGLTYYTTFLDLNIDAVLTLAASSSDVKILQTPVILTTDNTEASIVVGEERPVVVSTTSAFDGTGQTSRYEYKRIGINLNVTPRINPQRVVAMDIEQTVDNVGGFEIIDGNRVPIITKRELSAQLSVADRSTIVLGGLVKTDARVSSSKVPLLGDIPLIGALFRSDVKSDSRSELLVLMTPYVLLTPQEVEAETDRLHNASQAADMPWPENWSDSRYSPGDDIDGNDEPSG